MNNIHNRINNNKILIIILKTSLTGTQKQNYDGNYIRNQWNVSYKNN